MRASKEPGGGMLMQVTKSSSKLEGPQNAGNDHVTGKKGAFLNGTA